MKKLFFILTCFVVSGYLYAQHKGTISNVLHHDTHDHLHEVVPNKRNCGTMEHHQSMLKKYPAYAENIERIEAFTQEYIKNGQNFKTNGIITIPVVFHVVYQNATENISDTRLTEQIDVLNQDFGKTNTDASLVPSAFQSLHVDTEIRFCLATKDPNGNPTTGITRTSTTVSTFSTSDDVKFNSSGGKDAWDTDKYLNIWVCDLGSSLLGYAQFPGGSAATDGVVLNYRYTGKTGAISPFNKGRTATHEVGHYLNLRHIWGDASGCSPDDFVSDTPTQDVESTGCPTFPFTDACQSSSPGVMFMNYMDYSDDGCMYMFTAGQKARMQAALAGPRSSLATSSATNCTGGGGGGPTTCDTLFYPFPGTPALYKVTASGQWGYVSGTNSYKDQSKANRFSGYSGSLNQCKGIILKFQRAYYSNANNKINVRLWNESAGKPSSSALISIPVTMGTIGPHVTSNSHTIVTFSSAVNIGSVLYAGFSFDMSGSNYAYPSDTVAVRSNTNGDTNPGIAWEQFSDGSWYEFSSSSSWNINLALEIMPILCPSSINVEDKLIDNSFNLQVFPNPNNGTFDIIYPLLSKYTVISVYNMLGQEVFSETITQQQDKVYQKKLDLSEKSKGLYVVRVTDGSFVAVKKVQVY